MLQKLNRYHINLLFALATSLAVAAFFFFWHPDPKDDLYRYFAWLDMLRVLTGDDLVRFVLSRGEVITMAYSYAIAQTGVYGLFQMIPTFLSLFIIQTIALDYATIKKIPMWKAWLAILIFLCMYEIFLIASGVRSTLAFSLVSLALYLEFVKNIKKARWLYLISFFIHLGSIIPITIRLLVSIQSKKVLYLILSSALIILILPTSSLIVATLEGNLGNNALLVSLYKLGVYLEYFSPLSGPFFYKIIKLLFIAFIAVYLYLKLKEDDYVKFYLFASILAVALLGRYLLWYRILELLIIGLPVLILKLSQTENTLHYLNRIFIIATVAIMITGIRVQVPYFTDDRFIIKPYSPKNNEGWQAN